MVKNIPELEIEIEKLKVKCAIYLDQCNKNAEEIERLEAEVERLSTPDIYYLDAENKIFTSKQSLIEHLSKEGIYCSDWVPILAQKELPSQDYYLVQMSSDPIKFVEVKTEEEAEALVKSLRVADEVEK